MTAVVLVGAGGWLGSALRRRLPDAVVVRAGDVLASGGRAVSTAVGTAVGVAVDAAPAGTAGDRPVVVNAAGARSGQDAELHRLNAELPALLAREAAHLEGHLVHLGSAAEYGMLEGDDAYREDGPERPGSPYGRSKLDGTRAALESGRVTVLRVFNIAANPPQEGTPLADVVGRTRLGLARGRAVELLSAGTVRDWVHVDFVVASVLRAVGLRAPGVFNVCSGTGVAMGDAVTAALTRLDAPWGVRDLGQVPATVVVGRPDRWRAASGLAQPLGAAELGAIIADAVSDTVSDTVSDAASGASADMEEHWTS